MSIQPSQTPQNETVSYLRGKETLVISVSKHLVNTHFINVFVPVHFYHLVFNDYYTISL